MNINKILLTSVSVATLALSGAVHSYGGYVLDSDGNGVRTTYSCVNYGDFNGKGCPSDEKPMKVVEPEPAPAPVVVKPVPKPVVVAPVPTPAPEPAPVVAKVINLDGVNFETSSNRLTSSSLSTLNAVAEELNENPNVNIVVEGYTDDRGDASFNLNLSQTRAEAVRDYLVTKGVSAANLSAKGFGEEGAIASNDSSAGRAENRRVELRIID